MANRPRRRGAGEGAVAAALSVLKAQNIKVEGSAEPYRVDERFDFWPSTRFWKSVEPRGRQGYGVDRLITTVTKERQ